MWFALWILFLFVIIAAVGWTLHAIQEQKRAWRIFADRYGLTFVPGTLFGAPAMNGDIKGRVFNAFTLLKDPNIPDSQNQSVVEVYLNDVFDFKGVVASNGFADFIAQTGLVESFLPTDQDWPKILVTRTIDQETAKKWFDGSKDRVRGMLKLSKLPFDVIFVSEDTQAFIALRTPDSLADPRQLNKILSTLYEVSDLLEKNKSIETDHQPS